MTETVQKTKKQTAMQTWLEALESGTFPQGQGALCRADGPVYEYCCIGVFDEVVVGTKWHNEDNSGLLVDDDGEGELVDFAHPHFAYTELGVEVTPMERDYLSDKGVVLTGEISRAGYLAYMNDQGFTFQEIADTIRELGWHE